MHKIPFIDNSGYPLESVKKIAATGNPAKKTVEFISSNCNWHPPGGGYGYSGLRALDLGLEQSSLRKQTTHMIKVTGRLQFLALRKLLDRLPPAVDITIDTRIWQTLNKKYEHPFCATQISLVSHNFYEQYFQSSYEDPAKGGHLHIEWMLYDKLLPMLGKLGNVMRFPCNVHPVRMAAHRLRSYNHPLQRAIYATRGLARQGAPNL